MKRIYFLLHNLFRRRQFENDLHDEIHSYLQILTDEKIAAGLPPAAALREAKVELGGVEAVKEAVRSVSGGSLLRELWQDLHYTLRTMGRQPAFLCVAVVTIALGVGINASVFSIFNSLLLRPLPSAGSNGLVSLYQTLNGVKQRAYHGGKYRFSYPEYTTYRDNNRVFTGLAAYHPEIRLLVDQNAQETEGQVVSCNYFNVLEASLALGRGFSEAECSGQGPAKVAVLSNSLWREQFASDSGIIGRTIRLNRIPVTVIGVASAGFAGSDIVPASVWLPLPMMGSLGGPTSQLDFVSPDVSWLELIGRRRDHVSISEVRANLTVIAKHIDAQHPGQTTDITASVSTLLGAPNKRQAMMAVGAVVLIAVGMVLMIACANLANLMLARSIARSKEIAMRLALGATRGRIVRQLLTEALFIAVLGGALGALIANWSGAILFRVMVAHFPAGTSPVQFAITPDMRVVAYAFLLTLMSGVAFGLTPALQSTRPDLNAVLKQESAGPEQGRRRSSRGVLIAGQVAICMVLLLASGLLVRAVERAQTVDPGFEMRNVALLSYDLARVGYSNTEATLFNTSLVSRLSGLPGVKAVVLASGSPLGDRHFFGGFALPGQSELKGIPYLEVSSGFFSLLNIPIIRGRDFTPAEAARGAKLLIVSESFARDFWPGADPLGKVVHQGNDKTNWEVIGVARDAEVGELGDSSHSFVYLPPDPAEQWMLQTVLVHYDGDYAAESNLLRAATKTLDPALKVNVARLENNLDPYRAISRLTAEVATILGLLALGLAMIGLYGTVAYGVNRRTREIGIRLALGAKARDVLALVIRQAMKPVLYGAIAGVVLCAAISQILSKLLFGVSPHDALTFAGVPIVLLAIALLAVWLPARRALRVDPVVALREN